MPVNMNPPPFPTPDNVNKINAPTPSDNPPVAGDAFAHAMAAAGNKVVDASHPTTTKPIAPRVVVDPLRQWLLGSPERAALQNLKTPFGAPSLGAATGAITSDLAQDDAPLALAKSPHTGDVVADPAQLLAGSLAALAAALAGGQARPSGDPPASAAGGAPTKVQAGPASPLSSLERADDSAAPSGHALAAAASPALAPGAAAADALLRLAEAGGAAVKAGEGREKALAGASLEGLGLSAGAAAPAPVPAAVVSVDLPVNAPGWEQELASKLTQVVVMKNDRAEVHLHPAELGPVDVQISFLADQALLLITAPNATTRDALEQALPHLRDMLAEQGITLGQATVQGERREQPPPPAHARFDDPVADATSLPEAPSRVVRLNGLVDVFA